MKIYIASSWKNQHAVEMLTAELRRISDKIIVNSFVEMAVETEGRDGMKFDFVEWINSPDGEKKFLFDIDSAMFADLLIYIGPSGTDAWAEVGAAYANGVPIMGLWAKGEPAGLGRRMVHKWHNNYVELLRDIQDNFSEKL